MSLGISTSWFGIRPLGAAALLDVLREAGVREAFVAAESARPLSAALGGGLREAGARVSGLEAPLEAVAARGSGLAVSLLSASTEVVRHALGAVAASVADARSLGCDLVVVRLGAIDVERGREREAELRAKLRLEGPSDDVTKIARELQHEVERRHDALLERACRALFAAMKSAPDMRFAVATPTSPLGFPSFATCCTLLDEFRGKPLGYWHDAAAARTLESLGLAPALAWSGEHAARAFGATMSDVAGSESRLPPGAGELDFKGLRETLPATIPVAIDVDARFGVRELQQAMSLLRSLGWG
ncbi:MAG: hypothetical protein IPH13_10220 [Planctomycetes bacterium]|nr:hypothetical protein [Planctomycetota bacterium]MCC7171407.1 hypothetical protein [Planctomycetota bacterium]